jgi:hypothetical protein
MRFEMLGLIMAGVDTMKMRRWSVGLIVLVTLVGWCSYALAGEAANVTSTGTEYGQTFSGYNYGWRFSVEEEITITHVGLIDLDAPGLASTHTIGLWKLPRTGDFQFICSVDISGTQGELIGLHRYVPITPITLKPDTEPPVLVGGYLFRDRYLLGVWSPAGTTDRTRVPRGAATISDAIRLGEVAPPWEGAASNYTAYLYKPQTVPPYTGLQAPWGALEANWHYGLNFKYSAPGVTASAGPDVEIYTSEQALTTVAGMATHIVPGTPMQYQWFEGDTPVSSLADVGANGEAPLNLGSVAALSIGDHTLRLHVTDGTYTSDDTMQLTVANTPPEAQPAPTSQIAEINADAIIITAEVADFDGDNVAYQWVKGVEVLASGTVDTPAGGDAVAVPDLMIPAGDARFPLGLHEVQLIVNDGVNPFITVAATVEVKDTTSPTLAPTPSTALLWPPNHDLIPVTIWANAADNGGGGLVLTASVQCSEDDGETETDAYVDSIDNGAGTIALRLRSERSGSGDGRVYTVTVTATDGSGNQSSATVDIRVPHDKRKK